MTRTIAALSVALMLLAAAASSSRSVAAEGDFDLESTIAFVSTRDNPTFTPLINAAEIYLMRPDGTNPRRLTFNSDGTPNSDGDGFPALSPDGKKIIFDSNRNVGAAEPLNTTELFLMNTDGSEQTPLLRGGSASWAPDSKNIVFHRSASGAGLPTDFRPGASTVDSAIFVTNVDDFLNGAEQPRNITNNQEARDDDPDWSPVSDQIAFTRHDADDLALISFSAELYVINADGTGLTRLTDNHQEERSPDWSPNGERLAFSCNTSGTAAGHEICVMNADGSGLTQLTHNTEADLTPSWSPDVQRIAFQRQPVGGRIQIWSMKTDGSDERQLTTTAGINLSPNWGQLRVRATP